MLLLGKKNHSFLPTIVPFFSIIATNHLSLSLPMKINSSTSRNRPSIIKGPSLAAASWRFDGTFPIQFLQPMAVKKGSAAREPIIHPMMMSLYELLSCFLLSTKRPSNRVGSPIYSIDDAGIFFKFRSRTKRMISRQRDQRNDSGTTSR